MLAILAALAVILALEAGLRLARERYDAALYQWEPERGYSLRPKSEGWNVTGGEAYVRINSEGLRDRERPVQRPPDTLRVAVLGASNAEAREVPLEQTFEAVIERKLAPLFEPRGKHVDVLNFGVTGYTYSQQYLTLRNHVWKYDPQVVVAIWDTYQFLRNTRETDPEDPQGDRAPFYVLRNGRLEPAEPAPLKSLRAPTPRQIAVKNRLGDWMNSSYLLSMVNYARVQLQKQIKTFRAQVHRSFSGAATVASGRPEDYIQWWPYLPYMPEQQEDWEIGEAFMLEMKEDCDRHGAEYWVVISDEEMQSHPDLAARNAFMRRRGLTSLDEADRRLARFCEANGIHVLTLAPPMGEYAVAHGVALHGTGADNAGHWNKLGNQVVGRLIAEELLSRSAMVQAWTAARE